MLAFKLTERSLGLISTVILVRILVPADFGVMAMAMSLIAILELLKSFSFDVALIQRRDVNREHLDTAWTFNLAFGVFVSVLMFACAGPAATYYGEPRLEAVVYALAAGWFVQSFENIGTVAFRRELQFQTEYRFLVAKKLAGVLVTLPLAFWLRNYWALVAGVVAGRALSVWISYRMHSYRPRWSLAAASDLLGFSGWLLINNVLYFFNERLTDFVIGRLAGAQALGLFNVSFEIANMPTTEIVAPINRAMLPGYSKIARESGELAQTYLDTVGVMALFSIPAGLGVAAMAGPLVTLVLGSQWLPAIPLIQILGVYGAIASIGTNTSSALLALGRQRALTALAAMRLLILIPAVIWATHAFGVVGTAWAILIVTGFMTPINFLTLLPVLKIRIGEFMGFLWRPIIAATVMSLAVGSSMRLLASAGVSNSMAHLSLGALTGFVSYAVVLGLLWQFSGRRNGAEGIILRGLKSRLEARRLRATQ
jgi:lipopolysaccharide exporter